MVIISSKKSQIVLFMISISLALFASVCFGQHNIVEKCSKIVDPKNKTPLDDITPCCEALKAVGSSATLCRLLGNKLKTPEAVGNEEILQDRVKTTIEICNKPEAVNLEPCSQQSFQQSACPKLLDVEKLISPNVKEMDECCKVLKETGSSNLLCKEVKSVLEKLGADHPNEESLHGRAEAIIDSAVCKAASLTKCTR